jgi:hypothetical protein
MQLGSDVQIRDGLLAENTLLREKPRLGFERTETTLHRASIRLNYLNGNRVSSTVVFESRPVSLMAQQQSGQPAADPSAPAAGQTPAPSGGFQFNAELMTDRALYYTGTFASGASDFMTLGLTKYINKVDGGASSIGYDSGTYTAGKVTGIGLTVATTAAGGLTRGALSEGKVVGGLFGRGGAIRGGVFNRGFIRFGWSWEGSAQGGRDVIRIGIGEAGSWIHLHIPVWYP